MSGPVDVSEDRLVEYVLGELRRDDAQALERLMRTDAELAAEVPRVRQAFDLLPYPPPGEPPADRRARSLAAAAGRAQSARKEAPPPTVRAARRVVWNRFIAAAAAVVALAFGFDSWRTRQELALQREVTATLEEPNVVRSFALAGTGTASGAVGRVTLDLDAKKGARVLKGVPVLPPGEGYRLCAAVRVQS